MDRKQTGLTSPFHKQWTPIKPMTPGTIYNSAGCNEQMQKIKRVPIVM